MGRRWRRRPARDGLAAGVLALGWLVLFGTELIYLKDWLAGGSAYRMNTVFKFGIQAWLLLGVGLRRAGSPAAHERD